MSCRVRVVAILVLSAPALTPGLATEVYRTPPAPLTAIVEAPPTPGVMLSPDQEWMLLLERPSLISLEELSQPELRLAGLRIRPRTNGPSRARPENRLVLRSVADGTERVITGHPDEARLDHEMWAPDGKHVAFTVTGDARIELWIAPVASGRARRLMGDRLNAAGGPPCEWLSDSAALLCGTVPGGRGASPEKRRVPTAPVIQQNLGGTNPARTYQDLLKSAHDEVLFEYYLGTQIVRVDLEGRREAIGPVGLVWSFQASPDARYILVQRLHRPFSYLVPAYRFPRAIEIWDAGGEVVRRIADLPLQEGVPMAFGSVPTGPRAAQWRADAPATVCWAEAADGGDARAEAEVRDRIYTLSAPFDADPSELAHTALRYGGMQWGSDELALVVEWWWKTRQVRTWIVRPGEPDRAPELLFDHSWEDRYNDPGDVVTRTNAMGRNVVMQDKKGKKIFLFGDGASPEGDRPFFDELTLETRKTRRLWRSEAPYYEEPVDMLDDAGRRLITLRESKDEVPQFFVRDVKRDELRQLTVFPHPTPQLAGMDKELIHYEREDGVKLTGTLYLPPDHDPNDGPLPLLMWAYPQEFKSADAAGQVKDSPYRFDRLWWGSPLLFLTRGYAVLDDPSLPIVGEGDEEPNDSFVDQLVSGAKAAVDAVVRHGVADPKRIAIGGHSYGAFMTANLLAHSDLFRAGVARSGAYNRTLTPFGFQSEERSLWEAPEIYFQMSPFMHAEKVNEPILLIHGDSDNNSGTFPMQSERYYNALKGHAATARLVMLPNESHGYRARESVLHMLWETSEWLDRYVRDAEVGASDSAAARE